MKRAPFAISLSAMTLCAVLSVGPAFAAGKEDEAKLKEASNFFEAGAAAFKAGRYAAAAEAFLKANETLPSPALLFSAAQAYRRQYVTEPSPSTLKRSIELYRSYLKADPSAKRREDAMEALQVLVPIQTRIDAESPAADPASAPAPADKKSARLLVTTGAEGAEMSLDGGPYQPAPLVVSVEPGPHRVKTRAPGYHEEETTVQGVADQQAPRHVELKAKAAALEVKGTSGAKVSVDGQVRATVPVAAIPVEPGSHFVTVTLSGHEPFSRTIIAGRDATLKLDADLPTTRQRKAAWATLGGGAAGAIATGILTGITFARQGEALQLSGRPASTPLTVEERDRYNRALMERNDFGQAAAITGGLSVAALAVGVGLFVLDEPEVVLPSDSKPGAPGPAPKATFEVGVGLLSVGVRGSF